MRPAQTPLQRTAAVHPADATSRLGEHLRAKLRARNAERTHSPLSLPAWPAGQQDAGPLDAGPLEAGPQEAGPQEAGPLEAGPAESIEERSAAAAASTSVSIVQRLAAEVRQLETAGRATGSHPAAVSCGCEALDDCLPDRGYLPGSVIEYLRAMPGCGASILAFTAAAAAMKGRDGFVVVVDTQHNIYPPALASFGIDLEKVVLVRPQSDMDALWAVDLSLRTPAVAAVVADVERIDDRSARRMQLAAEQGGGLALLLRPASAQRAPSWAEVQWLVRALPANLTAPKSARPVASPVQLDDMRSSEPRNVERRLQVQLLRVRGGQAGAVVRLQVDAKNGTLKEIKRNEPTGALHLASQLASAKSSGRRAAAG